MLHDAQVGINMGWEVSICIPGRVSPSAGLSLPLELQLNNLDGRSKILQTPSDIASGTWVFMSYPFQSLNLSIFICNENSNTPFGRVLLGE